MVKLLQGFIFILVIFITIFSYSQPDEIIAYEKNYDSDFADELDFYRLENQIIVSASKKEETIFEAPVSSTVITRQQIKRSGATNLQEAMRLVPGLIVRQQTNGNFDIHIRGFDNVPPNSDLINAANSITLVMIDGRPVYNFFSGGTFWETLPIDLIDVERIEVVRGPSSALYGPNAAAGVINIITRRIKKEAFYTNVDFQGGTPFSLINNASIGYNVKNVSFILSGNYSYRKRHDRN